MASNTAPHNNGMHPTADTPPVILRQSLRAAGDAGRSASRAMKTHGEELERERRKR